MSKRPMNNLDHKILNVLALLIFLYVTIRL